MREARRRVLPALVMCGLLVSAMVAGYSPADVVAAGPGLAGATLVRVGIGRSLPTASVGATATYGVSDAASGAAVLSSGQGGSLLLQADPAGVRVGAAVYAGPVRLTATGGFVTFGGHSYRGYLEVLRNARGLLSVVNVLDLEEYLLGVVPKEMNTGWPAEALKAQAVAARTYALVQVGQAKYAGDGFDLTADASSQAYGGTDVEETASTAAVVATRGQVVVDENGRPISTYFFSASGGMTESEQYVWDGPGHSYLQGVADYDQLSPYYRWEVTLSLIEVQQRLQAYGIDVGILQALQPNIPSGMPEVAFRSPATGQYRDYIAVGSRGQALISATHLRTAIGLRSRVFTVVGTGGQAQPVNVVRQGTSLVTMQGAGMPSDRGVAGSYALGAGGRTVLLGDGVQALGVRQVPAVLTFAGRGYGHGVGLSQWGARAMATLGNDYMAILSHYYTGTRVVQR